MNSATDREPMDSAVRVTVLTQRGNGLARPASGTGKRAADEDREDPRRVTKKHRTEKGDRTDQMVVVYDVMPSQTETKLYTRLHKMDTHHTLAQQFRCARRILNGLGRCAADLVSYYLQLMWNKLECTSIFYSCGLKYSKAKL